MFEFRRLFMAKGYHEKLLDLIIDKLKKIERFREYAESATITDKKPGTKGFNNKCEFSDGAFIVSRQHPDYPKNNRLTLFYGHGRKEEKLEKEGFSWRPSDDELHIYADNKISWVIDCLDDNNSQFLDLMRQYSDERVVILSPKEGQRYCIDNVDDAGCVVRRLDAEKNAHVYVNSYVNARDKLTKLKISLFIEVI